MSTNTFIECKYCKSEIKKGATICHNCKKDLRGFLNKHPILTIFILIMLIGFFGSNFSETENDNEITSGSCNDEMKTEVSKWYKSPSTVNFISCNWNKNEGIYGEADAGNAYGGIVRSTFLCNGNTCLINEK